MHVDRLLPRGAAAPLVLGLLLALAGCGGGGGGDTATTPSGTTLGGPAAGGGAPQGGGSPTAEVRYSLAAVGAANTTTAGYQTLTGVAPTGDGGFRVTWSTGEFVPGTTTVVTTYYEQRFDASGNRVGGETQLPGAPGDIAGSSSVTALGGGTIGFQNSNEMRPSLSVQHVAPDGTVDGPFLVAGNAYGHAATALRLPNDSVALAYQPVTSVGPGEIGVSLMVPSAR